MANRVQFEAGKMAFLRMSEADAYLLNELYKVMGLNASGLIRLGIRQLAKQQGIQLQNKATLRKRTA
jgi:hypothetical protein